MQVLGERFEGNNFLKSLYCAQAWSIFGQIANADIEYWKKDFQKIIANKVNRSCVNVAKGVDRSPSTPNRDQTLNLEVYSACVYAMLYSWVITDVNPRKLGEKLRLELPRKEKRSIIAAGI